MEKQTQTQDRMAIAENPNTPSGYLELLAKDGSWWVRRLVARNPNTPASARELLAQDADWRVRATVTVTIPRELYDAFNQAVSRGFAIEDSTTLTQERGLRRDAKEIYRRAIRLREQHEEKEGGK